VESVLIALEKLAGGLYPAWLKGAERILGVSDADLDAIRALAMKAAGVGEGFGPFLADLAERAIRPIGAAINLPAETRAAGLAKVIATSLDRRYTAILVNVPEGLTLQQQLVLVGAFEWLAYHGQFAVWLTGGKLERTVQVDLIDMELPSPIDELNSLTRFAETDGFDEAAGAETYPALPGSPRWNSEIEREVARHLRRCDWAAGHVWNRAPRRLRGRQRYQVDLVWEAERCVVEIDGDEHRGMLLFQSDRRRDVELQLAGYAVLRFTVAEVSVDMAGVLERIGRFLHSRRTDHEREHRHG
jgi:very-short-patch-repair endonuclease